LNAAQALAFCRVPRKPSAADTVSLAFPLSKKRASPVSRDAQSRFGDRIENQLPETPPGVPFWARQASEVMPWTQPWPLQAFWPLQALVEDLQALWPLQALTPLQSVELVPNDGLYGVCALTTEATSVPAANADVAARINDFFM
jgi:hypothetical protein